jgi:hemoglobin
MRRTIDEAALSDLVNSFYAKVRNDPLIGPVFNDAITDWPEHLEKLQAFWSSVMLTTGRYKGRPVPAHLKHSDRISKRSFDRWLALWKETTEELIEPEGAAKLQCKAVRIAESLQLAIAFARDPACPLRAEVSA